MLETRLRSGVETAGLQSFLLSLHPFIPLWFWFNPSSLSAFALLLQRLRPPTPFTHWYAVAHHKNLCVCVNERKSATCSLQVSTWPWRSLHKNNPCLPWCVTAYDCCVSIPSTAYITPPPQSSGVRSPLFRHCDGWSALWRGKSVFCPKLWHVQGD